MLQLVGTDDPAHGAQEGISCHGYDRQHLLYPPLLLVDGTCQHSTAGLFAAMRAHWPQVAIELRVGSAGAGPASYEWCELERIAETFGAIPSTG